MFGNQKAVIYNVELDLKSAFHTGIRNQYYRPIKRGRGVDKIEGLAFSITDAFAATFPTTIPNLLATTTTGTAVASASAYAIGLDNAFRQILNTGRGNDVVTGVAVANADAVAKANVTAFTFGVTSADATAVVFANASSIGINNGLRSFIRTGRGNDHIIGNAIAGASADATAVGIAVADALADIDSSAIADSHSQAIARITSVTATGIHNYIGRITTGTGSDKIVGTAFVTGQAIADASSISIAIAALTATSNASAMALAEINLARAEGINNTRGTISTGLGSDEIFGIGAYDLVSLANAVAEAAAFAEDALSAIASDSLANATDVTAIGINNKAGKINTGWGYDSITGYGMTAGIVGGEIDTGDGDDLLHAAIIDSYHPFTGEFTISQDQTNAISDVKVHLGRGNDIVDLGGFGKNVFLDGGAGFDTLKLQGSIDDYTIRVVSAASKLLTLEQSGNQILVGHFEQFSFGDTAFNFNQLSV